MNKWLSIPTKAAKFVGLALFCMALANCAPQGKSAQGQHEDPTPPPSEGVGSGGGGDVVVCYDSSGKIIDMESFDIWMAPQNGHNLTFDYGKLGENDDFKTEQVPYMQQVEATLAKIEKFDPRFAVEVKRIAVSFTQDEIDKAELFVKTDALELNGDSGVSQIGKASRSCAKVTHERMFWQIDDPAADQVAYKLVDRLWKAAPERVKAEVVVHESVWRNERQLFNNPATSLNTQHFNAVFHSREIAEFDGKKYLELLSELKYEDGRAWSKNDIFSVKFDSGLYQANTVTFSTDPDGKETVSGQLIQN